MDDEQKLESFAPNSHALPVVIVHTLLLIKSTIITESRQEGTFSAKTCGLSGLGLANVARNTLPNVPVPSRQ